MLKIFFCTSTIKYKNPKFDGYYRCVLCSIPCLFVYLRMRISTSEQSCGIAFRFPQYGASTCVRFGCARHASCVDTNPKKNHSGCTRHGSCVDSKPKKKSICCTWIVSCVTAWQTKNQKPESMASSCDPKRTRLSGLESSTGGEIGCIAVALDGTFFFLVFESTWYSRNAHKWRCSNKEARKRLARRHSRNGPWNEWQTHTHVVK